MSGSPRIIIISGPGRGRSFEPEEELVHLGRGEENQIVIDDPSLAEHHASIVQRNGRYAIFTPEEGGVEVDGNTIPAEKWVWLPDTVKVQLGKRTTFVFTCKDEPVEEPVATAATSSKSRNSSSSRSNSSDNADATLTASPLKSRSKSDQKKSKRRKKRKSRKSRDVARFITDQGGDTLVKLGEDGQMPELMLAENITTKTKEKKTKKSNPALLYVAISVSIVMSLAMLFIDTDVGGSGTVSKSRARSEIKRFYGSGNKIERYQQILRDAELAHYRRDFQQERREYRKVLDLLNSEDNIGFTGLTGKPQDDEELKQLIGILLSR